GWARSESLTEVRSSRLRNSVGAGLRVPTFILQRFFLSLNLEAAKRTDADRWAFYFSIGPSF
ncbi:MAG: hypothetical protein HY548_06045, partial [Elusimicrobia bacterium]|nr:hypothetical protein [Elusimicrobiota bacterium]